MRLINRFELKYIVDAFRANAFLREAAPFLEPDPHAGPSGMYRVTSLYYDSPEFHFYRAKIEGLKFRRKLRLRVYPGGDPAGVRDGFVEIKQRIDRTVQKRRLFLGLEAAESLCRMGESPEGLDAVDRAVAEEVRTMVVALQLRPACVVSYVRRALLGGRYEPGLRVTLDTMVGARVHGLSVRDGARNRAVLPPSLGILEVKVNERVPRWLAGLLATYDFSLRRVSKYCAGLEKAYASRPGVRFSGLTSAG